MTESEESTKYEPYSNKKMAIFGIGGIIGTFMWIVRGKMQLFATMALGVPVSMIIVIIGVWVIWDAINDPVTGYFLDKSKRFTSKHGKRYPFILIGQVGALLSLILLFLPIVGNPTFAIIWLIIAICIWDQFQTILELSSHGLIVDLFRDEKQRVKLGSILSALGAIGTLIGSILIPIMLGMFGGQDEPMAYMLTTTIMVVVCLVLTVPYSFAIREPAEMKELRTTLDGEGKSSSPLMEIIVRALKDRNWVGYIFGYVFWVVGITCLTVGIDFYMVDALGLPIGAAALPSLALLSVNFLFIPVWIKISKKLGARKTYFWALITCFAAAALFTFSTDLPTTLIFAGLAGIGNSGQAVVFNAVYSEAIDNATVKSGKREESSYLGVMRFFSATGVLWQTIIFAVVAGISGYNPAAAIHSDAAKLGLRLQISIIPAMIQLIGALVFLKLNTITREVAIGNNKKLIEMGL